MKEIFLKLILSMNETVNMVVMVISIVSGIIAIGSAVKESKENEGATWVSKCIIVASILVAICTVVRLNITEVPNVVNKTYQDACNILSDHGLNYNLVLDNGVYVLEQNPVAGTIVKKNSQVELITQPIGNNPEVKRIWEDSLGGIGYGDVAITFRDTELILSEEGITMERYGGALTDYIVKQAYLLEENVGVEYHDYVIENNRMVFKHIPQGIHFQLILLLEGYEEIRTEIVISSQNMIEGTYSFSLGVTGSETELLLPTTFYVADANKSTVLDVEYLSDIRLWVQWPGESSWRGDYYTDAEGRFPYNIMINENQSARVRILDPFDNGVDYECEVTLYAPEFEKANPKDIIFLKEDGTCEVISTAEYFMW